MKPRQWRPAEEEPKHQPSPAPERKGPEPDRAVRILTHDDFRQGDVGYGTEGSAAAPAEPNEAQTWANVVRRLLPLMGKDCDVLDDLEDFLRRRAALAQPVSPAPEPLRKALEEIQLIAVDADLRATHWRTALETIAAKARAALTTERPNEQT